MGQTNQVEIKVRDFEGHLAFLSSGWFEGRETGENGGYMAADYIASQMNRMGCCQLVIEWLSKADKLVC